jgi:exodeoxyribonuclease V beta subunit
MSPAGAASIELQPAEFDICGPPPTGVTVLEASAGTGKTYTIASLAARYVADGIPLERLLLVTFTRIATGELRERVRDRLVAVERGLTRALDGVLGEEDDLLALLAEGSPAQVAQRRDRLALAVASFDAATIATTHGFCQEVLGGLGIAGDLEPDVTFVEDLSDLVSEVVDDLYVRRFSRAQRPPAFGRAEAAAIARAAIDNPGATIVCGDSETAQMRGRLAAAARAEYEARKRATAVMTYDDLVMRLQSTLSGPGGPAAAEQLRSRYDVVLVDEFQDTDPAQWEIMRLAFAASDVTLVLIADPKQAIYAFRGADVYAYLAAARAAGARATLPINWRSDQGLIDAHDALLSGVKFGHEGIAYRQVRAAHPHQRSRLSGAPVSAPMRIRVALREEPTMSLTQHGFARKPSASAHIVADLAADVVTLLQSHACVSQPGGANRATEVRPDHLAVLVRTNRQAAMVRDALGEVGVPAVINGAGSVFATGPARDWLALLEALERPASLIRAHAAALTPFIGWSAERLAAADDDDGWAWEEVHRRLHDWARILRGRGVASLLETITASEALPARMLAEANGERRLTDLRHIGQLLHAASTDEQLGATALTAWLRTRIAEADQDTGDEERSRRLESDAEALQVLTIHRSKGLEFPIVYVPFLWEPGWIPDRPQPPVFFHDPQADDARTIDVSLAGADFNRHREQNVSEQRGEDLRLAYVALTRARHQVVLWWAGSWDSRHSPLARLLFSRDERGDVSPTGNSTPTDAAMFARLKKLAELAPESISVESTAPGPAGSWQPALRTPPELAASRFDRSLDLRWRRTSYTDITATVHDAWVTSEPEEPLISDEPPAPEPTPEALREVAGVEQVPLAAMPVGPEVGTFVHRVLEATDFAAVDLPRELAARIDEVRARRAIDAGDPETVIAGLALAIETPLGPVLDGLALRDFARTDRLDELGFELPLAGGDRPRGTAELSRIAAILGEFLPDGDPLAGYARRLGDADLRQSVRGYLTGSLDLVVRLPGPRFAVLDYKTNWLGDLDAPLTVTQYGPSVLAVEMQRHHYVLQALLYLVALHRYLRWRLPGADPESAVAGVAYLFLRGMTGADAPVNDGAPCGVFGWRPPAGMVTALSDSLDAAEGPTISVGRTRAAADGGR